MCRQVLRPDGFLFLFICQKGNPDSTGNNLIHLLEQSPDRTIQNARFSFNLKTK